MKRITIVDDEPHVLRVLKMSLEREGYSVKSYLNGEDAIESLYDNHPDVLVTDIQMPRMTGKELCEKIQQDIPERKFLIFVLTSRTEIEHREWSRQINNLQFLEKPVSIRNLVEKLDCYFSRENGTQA